jgi:hypothetical protein
MVNSATEIHYNVHTPEELIAKLDELKAAESPEIIQAMKDASGRVEGVSKDYCTPGKSPYYKAPYQDDKANRMLAHMRDQITSEVQVDGDTIVGFVFVQGSAPGEPWAYALPVFTGTYDYFQDLEMSEGSSTGKVDGMKGMPPRPVIPDAIRYCQDDIMAILSRGVHNHLRRVWLFS